MKEKSKIRFPWFRNAIITFTFSCSFVFHLQAEAASSFLVCCRKRFSILLHENSLAREQENFPSEKRHCMCLFRGLRKTFPHNSSTRRTQSKGSGLHSSSSSLFHLTQFPPIWKCHSSVQGLCSVFWGWRKAMMMMGSRTKLFNVIFIWAFSFHARWMSLVINISEVKKDKVTFRRCHLCPCYARLSLFWFQFPYKHCRLPHRPSH